MYLSLDIGKTILIYKCACKLVCVSASVRVYKMNCMSLFPQVLSYRHVQNHLYTFIKKTKKTTYVHVINNLMHFFPTLRPINLIEDD